MEIKSPVIELLNIPQPIKEGIATAMIGDFISPTAGRVCVITEWQSAEEIIATGYAISKCYFAQLFTLKTEPSNLIGILSNAREGYGFKSWEKVNNFNNKQSIIEYIGKLAGQDIGNMQAILDAPILVLKDGYFVDVELDNCNDCIKNAFCDIDVDCKLIRPTAKIKAIPIIKESLSEQLLSLDEEDKYYLLMQSTPVKGKRLICVSKIDKDGIVIGKIFTDDNDHQEEFKSFVGNKEEFSSFLRSLTEKILIPAGASWQV